MLFFLLVHALHFFFSVIVSCSMYLWFNTGQCLCHASSSTDPRPAGHPEILDPPRPDVVHPPVHPDGLARRPRLLDRVCGTNVRHLAFHVLLDDDVERSGGGRVGEVEGGDVGGERGEPAGEGGLFFGDGGGGGGVFRSSVVTGCCAPTVGMSGEHDYICRA